MGVRGGKNEGQPKGNGLLSHISTDHVPVPRDVTCEAPTRVLAMDAMDIIPQRQFSGRKRSRGDEQCERPKVDEPEN